jgi:cytochrome c oxidase subunit I+III
VTLVFFAGATAMVVIPSTIQVFAWSSTIFTGLPRFKTPLLFIVGFILFFVTGGLTGVMFVAIPFTQQVTDTYFVVAHFHYIIFGAAVFPIFAGMYYWFPKVTGRMYDERWGQISFWVIFVGTNLLFFPMHIVGLLGMPRRVYTYPGEMGWTAYNLAETVGGFVTLAGMLLLFGNLVVSYRRGRPAGPDPWHGATLEWTTSSPPPEYNFAVIPRVRSAYPNWEPAPQVVGALDRDHEQVETSFVDGELQEVAEMPHASPWPIVLAVCVSGMFAVLAVAAYEAALVFAVLALLTLVAWHWERRPVSGLVTWGMAMLVAAEATLLSMLVGTYFYLRFKNVVWPPRGIPEPKVALPLIMLAVLVVATAPLWRGTRGWLLAALAGQFAYLAVALHSYAGDLDRFTPQDHAYGSIYYTLLGADHAHVLIGILLSAWVLVRLRRNAVRAVALYWYAVTALTVVVTLTTLSPAL